MYVHIMHVCISGVAEISGPPRKNHDRGPLFKFMYIIFCPIPAGKSLVRSQVKGDLFEQGYWMTSTHCIVHVL